MSKVSVVVPVYNAGNKLDQCIKSVLNQTFKDFELILVNDGSTDNSLNKCRKYQKKDQRIIVIDKPNEGSIATRRKGVESSNSQYTMFVDADDWADQKMIETLYEESTKSCADITVCNMHKVLGKSGFFKQKNKSAYFSEEKVYNKEDIKKVLVTAYFHGHSFPSSLCAKLYKNDLLLNSGKYLGKIKFLGEDLFYNLEMFLKADKVKVFDKALYYYRSGGLTSKHMPHLFDDAVNGYQIQKEVVDKYFQDTKQHQCNGISITLLNTFKTCLYNLFNSDFNEWEIEDLIRGYVLNESIVESIDNKGAIKYFSPDYLEAIRGKDIEFLFKLGKKIYKRRKARNGLLNIVNKFPIV